MCAQIFIEKHNHRLHKCCIIQKWGRKQNWNRVVAVKHNNIPIEKQMMLEICFWFALFCVSICLCWIKFCCAFLLYIYFVQIESDDDGLKILHILGVEHRHSGEIQCIVYNSLNPVLTQRSCYTDLAVLPRPAQLANVNGDRSDAGVGGFYFMNSTPIHCTDLHRTTSITHQAFKPIADVPAYLIRGPDDCTALIGGTVCLTVTYGGHPKPTILWKVAVSGNNI